MATIAQTAVSSVKTPLALTQTTGTSSDTFAYASGTGQKLLLLNTTGSPITATITGSTATTIAPPGLGGTVSVASGIAITVAAGALKRVSLDDISAYLSGVISISGGSGMTYMLYA